MSVENRDALGGSGGASGSAAATDEPAGSESHGRFHGSDAALSAGAAPAPRPQRASVYRKGSGRAAASALGLARAPSPIDVRPETTSPVDASGPARGSGRATAALPSGAAGKAVAAAALASAARREPLSEVWEPQIPSYSDLFGDLPSRSGAATGAPAPASASASDDGKEQLLASPAGGEAAARGGAGPAWTVRNTPPKAWGGRRAAPKVASAAPGAAASASAAAPAPAGETVKAGRRAGKAVTTASSSAGARPSLRERIAARQASGGGGAPTAASASASASGAPRRSARLAARPTAETPPAVPSPPPRPARGARTEAPEPVKATATAKAQAQASAPLSPTPIATAPATVAATTAPTATTAPAASHGGEVSEAGEDAEGPVLEDVLLLADSLAFLSYRDLVAVLPRLNRRWRAISQSDEQTAKALWAAACASIRREASLYAPFPLENAFGAGGGAGGAGAGVGAAAMVMGEAGVTPMTAAAWKRFFFDQLWPARHKWGALESEAGAAAAAATGAGAGPDPSQADAGSGFKIKVCVRFRPGARGNRALSLPLHQFLRLKREEARKVREAAGLEAAEGEGLAQATSAAARAALGERPPEEFVDPVSGRVMADPVRLPDSGAYMDRQTIMVHLRRIARKDPFTGRPLHASMLEEAPELRGRIEEWRAEQARRDGHKIGVDAVQTLVDAGGEVTPEMLEALVEAERLKDLTAKAEAEAAAADLRKEWGHGDDAAPGRDGGKTQEELDEEFIRHARELSLAEAEARAAGEGQDWADEMTLGRAGGGEGGAGADGAAGGAGAGGDSDEEDVAVPLARKARGAHGESARVLGSQKSRVVMFVPGTGVRPFHFNAVHEGGSEQADVYAESGRPAIVSALNGFNACVLCYGQTGSGKTHTIFGPDGSLERVARQVKAGSATPQSLLSHSPHAAAADVGLAVRACAELLLAVEAMASTDAGGGGGGARVACTITAQYVEIYNNAVTCLVTGRDVMVRRETGAMAFAEEVPVETLADAVRVLEVGQARKRFAATAMNERSSRAHTLLVLSITQARGDTMVKSHLHICDLAGCERVKRSQVVGGRLVEATNINLSLLTLGRVISALVGEERHVPYNEAALTILLRPAFGGNSRTTTIITARMDDDHGDETLQALRFGERCGMITNVIRSATASVSAAMAAVDASISLCEEQIRSLAARGKTHLPAYGRLKDRYTAMVQKRAEIAAVESAKAKAKANAKTAAGSAAAAATTTAEAGAGTGAEA